MQAQCFVPSDEECPIPDYWLPLDEKVALATVGGKAVAGNLMRFEDAFGYLSVEWDVEEQVWGDTSS